MLERLAFALILLIAGGVGYHVFTRHQLMRIAKSVTIDPILANVHFGIPTIVYFTTPMCIPCRTQQQPALQTLSAELGENAVQIVKIDATQDPSAAQRWGVMSAPTTFVLDGTFQPKHVNHGVADVNKLKQQLGISAA